MRKDIEDWERKSYYTNQRIIYRTSPELEFHVKIMDPSIEKQRLIEEFFMDCFNKAQAIIDQDD